MNAPRRLVDDPAADPALKRTLGDGAGARPLDELTRRRLGVKLARAAALPAVAAWWLFVKSAVAALGVVAVGATAATVTGAIEWPASRSTLQTPDKPRTAPAPRAAPLASEAAPEPPPELVAPAPPPARPSPVASASLPTASASAGGALAIESTLLEQARREMRHAPAVALQIAGEHAQRFPQGQLAAERTLLQLEALHRLGRDGEARSVGRGLLHGTSGELYRERARQLLGERPQRDE